MAGVGTRNVPRNPAERGALENKLREWCQCLVCLRLTKRNETRCHCGDYHKIPVTILIASEYDVGELPPEIRQLLYPHLTEALPAGTLTPPAPSTSPASTSPSPQQEEELPSERDPPVSHSNNASWAAPAEPVSTTREPRVPSETSPEDYEQVSRTSPVSATAPDTLPIALTRSPCDILERGSSSQSTPLPTKNLQLPLPPKPKVSKVPHSSLPKQSSSRPSLPKQKANASKGGAPSLIGATPCVFCGKVVSYLDDHLRMHIKETPFECPHCHKGFSARRSFTRHIKLYCPSRPHENPYSCPVCKKAFRTKSILKKHSLLHATRRTLYCCTVCRATFNARSTLEYHMSVKHSTSEYKCEECGKGFPYESILRRHLEHHQNVSSHICLFCKKGFENTTRLSEHMRTHTGERPYFCSKCDRSYRKRNDLRYHLRDAHDVQVGRAPKHSCIFCRQQFARKDRFYGHLCTHIQERWFTCKICGIEFAAKRHMYSHLRQFHKKC